MQVTFKLPVKVVFTRLSQKTVLEYDIHKVEDAQVSEAGMSLNVFIVSDLYSHLVYTAHLYTSFVVVFVGSLS